jgi:hypothetical protein
MNGSTNGGFWNILPNFTGLLSVAVFQRLHSVARKARRAEAKVRRAFPDSGSVKYIDPWEKQARENCNWDHGNLAEAFRSFCTQKKIKLDAQNVETVFAKAWAGYK